MPSAIAARAGLVRDRQGERAGVAAGSRRPSLLPIAALAVAVLCACSVSQAQRSDDATAAVVTVSYAPSDADFPNPERGLHRDIQLTRDRDVGWVRGQGLSLARSYVRLDDYRERPLPESLLSSLREGFGAVRRAGIKVVLRFSYNFAQGEPDAPLPQVLEHIAQLAGVLRENDDVIAVVQAGFVGAWGEWHTSTRGLDSTEAKRAILEALLRALPRGRMVQLRYPRDWLTFYPQPLTGETAFSETDQARVGHHNDCFLANAEDAGTYSPSAMKPTFQQYLEAATPYVVVGGETCQVTPERQRTDCTTALAELQRFHWTYLNGSFYEPALSRFKSEGCYATISRLLGYRFCLLRLSVDREARAGGTLSLSFDVVNEGWASLLNDHGASLVLRQETGGRSHTYPLAVDARRWAAGTTTTVATRVDLDASLPEGRYELLLHLHDTAPALAARPEYSIRLANTDVWEPATGFNRLLVTLAIAR